MSSKDCAEPNAQDLLALVSRTLARAPVELARAQRDLRALEQQLAALERQEHTHGIAHWHDGKLYLYHGYRRFFWQRRYERVGKDPARIRIALERAARGAHIRRLREMQASLEAAIAKWDQQLRDAVKAMSTTSGARAHV